MANDLALDPSTPGLSQLERVVDTFVAPSKTFKDILRSAAMWLPILLLIASTASTAYVVEKEVGFATVYQNQLRMSPRMASSMDQIPPEQKAAAVARTIAGYRMFSYGAAAPILVILLLYSLVLWASFNFGLGATTSFAQVFAVTMYAALPYILQSLLTILTLTLGGNAEAYDLKNPVGTNLAYYLPDAPAMVKGLLQSFDVVKLWSVILQVLGMAIVAKKTITQSAIVIGIFWLLGVALTVVGALFS